MAHRIASKINDEIGSIFNMLGDGDIPSLSDHERKLESLKRIARTDLREYMRLMYPGYVVGKHIDTLIDVLEAVERGEIKRLMISMPPRHSKSMHTSEGFPAWFLGRNPDKRVIAASHTQRLAETFSRRVRGQVTSSHWPFPWVGIAPDNGGVGQWDTENYGGGYLAVGVGGSVTGQGGDLIIVDDPHKNMEEAESPVIREKVWEWYKGTLYTRRQPGAAIIVMATRWHEDDLIGRLIADEEDGGDEWHVVNLPAQWPDGSFLWPEFWPDEEYEMAKRSDTRVWSAQYQGRPSTEGGNMLREAWFGTFDIPPHYDEIHVTYDTSDKVGLSNDFTACSVIGTHPAGYDVIHVHEIKVEFPDLIRDMDNRMAWAMSAFAGVPVSLVIEDAKSGTSAIQYMKASRPYAVYPVQSYRANEKELRVMEVTPLVETGRVRVPAAAPWKKPFFTQLQEFPYGKHDDMVDAFTIGLRHAAGIGAHAASDMSMSRYNDDSQDLGLSYRRRAMRQRGEFE